MVNSFGLNVAAAKIHSPCRANLLDKRAMRYLAFTLGTLALLASTSCAAPAHDLFTGGDLAGWEFVATPATDIKAVCRVLPGGVIAASGKPVGYLATTASHENYRLHVEWRWPGPPGNGGVLVHISSGPKDRAWPLCFQIQTKNKYVGDVLPMAGATFTEPLAPDQKTPQRPHSAPDSEKPAGEWNTCEVICRGDTIEVIINGVHQNGVTKCSFAKGRIGFQFEGTAFELRNVTVQSLD
jgi:hypothetical protein